MIFNMVGGGGGSGATLVVSSPVNVSVTVSKDDKSYTKNSGSLGSTTFKGLATGTWTITINGNGQTATRTIEITADYAITIAFFSATINITYPANSTCVVTNSGGQTVASDTNTTSSEKTFIATVNATGTYTVTATATDGSGRIKSQSVEITSEGQSVYKTLGYELILYSSGEYGVPFTARNGYCSPSIPPAVPTITNETTHFTMIGPSGFSSSYGPTNAVNVTGYKTLSLKFKHIYSSSVDPEWRSVIGLATNLTDYWYDNWAVRATLSVSSEEKELTIDLSGISGDYYILLGVFGDREIHVYDLRLL